MYPAIESVGRAALLIKDNKILCEVRVETQRADHSVSIRFKPDDYARLIAPMYQPSPEELHGFHPDQLLFVRFFPYSGEFLDTNTFSEQLDTFFEGARIVDMFNFGWGLAPDTFKSVEGFGNARLT